ncbi:hypothetical protein Mp_2g15720 [Marchantia polymorpha subsp. ruderalis]|uniref:Uncharacterized protein n=1 Tax=Marchantia polymorpha TaxID=3197 RepID=A0A2R6WK57_MARPO|nr:hypothetical protein MARPO_0082s0069 [Marchantia polymorpha]BBN02490.1 hypothetical protein Mp_2g15720 [Marchantia polymorpha subsp. ruderalis]|eukprot:PTQ34238.1 hypothetical protein MARPO_0082s0069 [Marchantia polymorpha]
MPMVQSSQKGEDEAAPHAQIVDGLLQSTILFLNHLPTRSAPTPPSPPPPPPAAAAAPTPAPALPPAPLRLQPRLVRFLLPVTAALGGADLNLHVQAPPHLLTHRMQPASSLEPELQSIADMFTATTFHSQSCHICQFCPGSVPNSVRLQRNRRLRRPNPTRPALDDASTQTSSDIGSHELQSFIVISIIIVLVVLVLLLLLRFAKFYRSSCTCELARTEKDFAQVECLDPNGMAR